MMTCRSIGTKKNEPLQPQRWRQGTVGHRLPMVQQLPHDGQHGVHRCVPLLIVMLHHRVRTGRGRFGLGWGVPPKTARLRKRLVCLFVTTLDLGGRTPC